MQRWVDENADPFVRDRPGIDDDGAHGDPLANETIVHI
jgi:hypothetical protein